MSEKHTPGPWRLHEQRGRTYVVAGRGVEAGEFMGHLIAAETTCPDWPANARLIAAAPDLLAACEAVLSAPVVAAPHPCWQMVRDAVARAKGATP